MLSVKNLITWTALVTVLVIGAIQMGAGLLRYIPFLNVFFGGGNILLEVVQVFAAVTLAVMAYSLPE